MKMNFQKYIQDLLHYQYVQGDAEEIDELLLIAA
tara:strand:+ start:389 stop:490 length:102 start_codon:yes stop_codon:yes gene_type:complete